MAQKIAATAADMMGQGTKVVVLEVYQAGLTAATLCSSAHETTCHWYTTSEWTLLYQEERGVPFSLFHPERRTGRPKIYIHLSTHRDALFTDKTVVMLVRQKSSRKQASKSAKNRYFEVC